MHCTRKFEEHKQSFLDQNYEQTFPNREYKQSNVHEKHKNSFPSENYNRKRHAHVPATSADSILQRYL